MNLWVILFFNFLDYVHRSHGAPSGVLPAGVPDAEEVAGKTEGDMVLTATQMRFLQSPKMARNGLINESRRWPNRLVFYKIVGAEFEPVHREAIKEAIKMIESKTCLTFRQADDSEQHYVAITSNPGGCYTAVGYQARIQEMNLQPYPLDSGCFRIGTIYHEFMHALGFYHEQSASDRDNYIRVVRANIVPGKEFNFQKYAPSFVTDFDVGYDYDSCLHYRPGAFSANGENTIVPLDTEAQIGQRLHLSSKDIDKINIMYKCPIKV